MLPPQHEGCVLWMKEHRTPPSSETRPGVQAFSLPLSPSPRRRVELDKSKKSTLKRELRTTVRPQAVVIRRMRSMDAGNTGHLHPPKRRPEFHRLLHAHGGHIPPLPVTPFPPSTHLQPTFNPPLTHRLTTVDQRKIGLDSPACGNSASIRSHQSRSPAPARWRGVPR